MFASTDLINAALTRLEDVHPFFGIAFLAFKRQVPIGATKEIVFSQIADDLLNIYYRPSHSYDGFYHLFQTSDKSDRWVKPRYGSTSLQRITADTFGDCFLHEKKTSNWGWRIDYVKLLQKHLVTHRIPAFELSVWLFRSEQWQSGVQMESIRDRLFEEFSITREERDALFDLHRCSPDRLRDTPVRESELLHILGAPPGAEPEEGAALHFLETSYVGPSRQLRYEPDRG